MEPDKMDALIAQVQATNDWLWWVCFWLVLILILK